eukprot:scaffold3454_cov122-Isochrysis_galbana.AAC.4
MPLLLRITVVAHLRISCSSVKVHYSGGTAAPQLKSICPLNISIYRLLNCGGCVQWVGRPQHHRHVHAAAADVARNAVMRGMGRSAQRKAKGANANASAARTYNRVPTYS